jgi:DNA-binding GntR family transcriptional regulator
LILRQKRAAQNGDEDAFLDLDEEFHLRIVDAARLPILYSVLGQLRGFVRVARLGQPRPASVLAEICEEHGQIVDALERRDAREAQRALVAHLHRRTGDEA